jgi:hypothetical protein
VPLPPHEVKKRELTIKMKIVTNLNEVAKRDSVMVVQGKTPVNKHHAASSFTEARFATTSQL